MEKYGKFVKIILLSFTVLFFVQNIDGDTFEKLRTLTQK